jgi:hypothetical protein
MTIAQDIARLDAIASEDGGDAPGSRYGTQPRWFVPYAIAEFYAMASSNGWPEDERAALDEYLSNVVNDSAITAEHIVARWEFIPGKVRRMVGSKRDVRALIAD